MSSQTRLVILGVLRSLYYLTSSSARHNAVSREQGGHHFKAPGGKTTEEYGDRRQKTCRKAHNADIRNILRPLSPSVPQTNKKHSKAHSLLRLMSLWGTEWVRLLCWVLLLHIQIGMVWDGVCFNKRDKWGGNAHKDILEGNASDFSEKGPCSNKGKAVKESEIYYGNFASSNKQY